MKEHTSESRLTTWLTALRILCSKDAGPTDCRLMRLNLHYKQQQEGVFPTHIWGKEEHVNKENQLLKQSDPKAKFGDIMTHPSF